MLKYWKELIMIIFGVGWLFTAYIHKNTLGKYKREKNNVESLTQEISSFRNKNDESILKIKELQYTVDEYEERLAKDEETIKSLNLKLKNVREDVRTTVETKIVLKDSLVQLMPDKFIFSRKEKWYDINQDIDFSTNPPTVDFQFYSRDSISHILYKVPKWKFLWWDIGTKCYEIYVVSHNPYSEIKYSRWINLSNNKKLRKRE